jgi:hypothetical protein
LETALALSFEQWVARYPRRVEAVGLSFVAIAAGVRFFIQDRLDGGVEALRYSTERLRLSEMWIALGSENIQQYVRDHSDKFFEKTLAVETVYWPVVVIPWVQAIFFLLGSTLIIVSKWNEDFK